MADLVFVGITVALFAALSVLIRAGRTLVSAVNVIGLIVAVLLAVFLVAALLFPEKF